MEESTDSDFTITYDEVPRSFDQVSGEEDVGIGADMSGDSVSPERDNAENVEQLEEPAGAAVGGNAKCLSPRQRHRRQSLARNKKKQWGKEWML